MIFSKLNAQDSFAAYPKAICQALEFLQQTDWSTLEIGKHPILGDKMFANVMDMTTHPFEGSHPEIHEKYIYLIYCTECGENFGLALYLGTEPIIESHPENDIAFLGAVSNESILTATAGCFGIFFPWDAHRPGLFLTDEPAVSRKCVIKISMDLLKEGT